MVIVENPNMMTIDSSLNFTKEIKSFTMLIWMYIFYSLDIPVESANGTITPW